MPLSTLVQLHILLVMTPALAGWMLGTPAHPMLARAMGVAVVQIRHVDPERFERSGQTIAVKRTASASIMRLCRLAVERVACRAFALRPCAVAVRPFTVAPPALARAP